MRATPDHPAPSARATYVLALGLCATQILGYVWVDSLSAERREQARADAVTACGRGNVVRANEQIDTRDPDDTPAERVRVRALFPLLDCDETLRAGEPVPLEAGQAAAYVSFVEVSRIPVVKDGRVVDSVAPPVVPVTAAPR